MGYCYSADHIAGDHIRTDMTYNTGEAVNNDGVD